MSRILSDEDIYAAYEAAFRSFRRHQGSVRGQQVTELDDPQYHLALAIESAVLEKLHKQKPDAGTEIRATKELPK